MDLWDIEWFAEDGTQLELQRHLSEEMARHQAARWLKEKPGSRVYLYRRRGEVRVLVQIFTHHQGHADQVASRP